MSDAPQHESHRRPHAAPMAAPFLEFDLPAEVHRLRAETTWSTGQNARTLIKYDDFRVVLTALQTHMRVPEHKTEGRRSMMSPSRFSILSRPSPPESRDKSIHCLPSGRVVQAMAAFGVPIVSSRGGTSRLFDPSRTTTRRSRPSTGNATTP